MYMQQSKSLKINKSVIDNPVMKRNPSQKRAIAHLSGPMMVLAGPGSGKTSVIVERTAHMIQEGKIPASSVLVVTFSRAAAVEMNLPVFSEPALLSGLFTECFTGSSNRLMV